MMCYVHTGYEEERCCQSPWFWKRTEVDHDKRVSKSKRVRSHSVPVAPGWSSAPYIPTCVCLPDTPPPLCVYLLTHLPPHAELTSTAIMLELLSILVTMTVVSQRSVLPDMYVHMHVHMYIVLCVSASPLILPLLHPSNYPTHTLSVPFSLSVTPMPLPSHSPPLPLSQVAAKQHPEWLAHSTVFQEVDEEEEGKPPSGHFMSPPQEQSTVEAGRSERAAQQEVHSLRPHCSITSTYTIQLCHLHIYNTSVSPPYKQVCHLHICSTSVTYTV